MLYKESKKRHGSLIKLLWHFLFLSEIYLNNPDKKSIKLYLKNKGTIIKLMVDIILMRISREGPTVSLSGSPTVSPTTAAEC